MAHLEIEGLHEKSVVLALDLDSLAQVRAVRQGDQDLVFLRHAIGKSSRGIVDEYEDDDLLIFLDEPLARGQKLRLTVEYEMEVLNYLPGRSWYPGRSYGGLKDRHTGTLSITYPEKIQVRAMGEPSEPMRDSRSRSVSQTWTIAEPARMLTFTFAERSIEETVSTAGRPTIRVFGSRTRSSRSRFRKVAEDVSHSLAFFQLAFGEILDLPEIQIVRIAASHGQSFFGFLQLSEGTFYSDSRGPSQLFRAHEVAHQWWGQAVGWATYRDQWLSEALAEYSAMMFIEAELEDGPELFAEMLEVYRQEQLGSLKTSMSRFARSWMLHRNEAARQRMGPIGIGYRASTWNAVTGYRSQIYQRGAWVLHMLRILMREDSGTDDAFLAALADFAATENGRDPDARAFREAMERHHSEPLGWFFDQWVADPGLPSYRWSYETRRTEQGGYRADFHVQQEDVDASFRMPIPILFRYEDGTEQEVYRLIDGAEKVFTIDLDAKPQEVVFAPRAAVLARIRHQR